MGLLGMYCDFEKYEAAMKTKLAPHGYKAAGSIIQLTTDTILNFTGLEVDSNIRTSALEALGEKYVYGHGS